MLREISQFKVCKYGNVLITATKIICVANHCRGLTLPEFAEIDMQAPEVKMLVFMLFKVLVNVLDKEHDEMRKDLYPLKEQT